MKAGWIFGVLGTVILAGCGGGPDSQDDSVIEASDTTKQELGVTRWFTKGAPAVIEGHDDNDQVVVKLQHATADRADTTLHKFTLREHTREATRTFSFAKAATGENKVLHEQFSPDLDPDHIFGLMNADFAAKQQSSSSTSLVSSFSVGGDLHPTTGSAGSGGNSPIGPANPCMELPTSVAAALADGPGNDPTLVRCVARLVPGLGVETAQACLSPCLASTVVGDVCSRVQRAADQVEEDPNACPELNTKKKTNN
jgi:hypothetical protein